MPRDGDAVHIEPNMALFDHQRVSTILLQSMCFSPIRRRSENNSIGQALGQCIREISLDLCQGVDTMF